MNQSPPPPVWKAPRPHRFWRTKAAFRGVRELVVDHPLLFMICLLSGALIIQSIRLAALQPSSSSVDIEQFVLATVQLIGAMFKLTIVNAGALTEPLIAPLMNIAMFCWLLFSIALCFWLWGWCKRKFS